MKRFWTIRANSGGQPDLPAGVSFSSPGDINLLTGDHTHILVGGIAVPAVDGHYHLRMADGSLVTRGGLDHGHDDAIAQDYFLRYCECEDALFATLLAPPWSVLPLCMIGEPDEETGEPGSADPAAWDVALDTTIRGASETILGFTLPAEIDNGRDLVNFMLGTFLARAKVDEKHYR